MYESRPAMLVNDADSSDRASECLLTGLVNAY